MNYKLVTQIKDNQKLRQSFFDLTKETFDLSFQEWFEAGYWGNRYRPYCLIDEGKVIASVSVNLMDIVWQGQTRNYLQIGTVMTAKSYRQQGLAKFLLETVIDQWCDKVDAIYLFANDTVLDFYPKFGFKIESEYQATLAITPTDGDFRRLDMDNLLDKEILKSCYQESNPFSKLASTDNYGLLMFYCDNFMRDCLYYSQKRGVVVVAIQNKDNLECLDIFGKTTVQLITILNELATEATKNCHLGFSTTGNQQLNQIKTDETLFIHQNGEDIFKDQKIMFPLLSHA